MKIYLHFKRFLRFIKLTLIFLISIIVIYFAIAALLSILKTHPSKQNCSPEKDIYITTNGVHLDIVMPVENVASGFLNRLEILPGTKYVSFGWGDRDFYINTPEWKDLTFKTAFKALFLKSETAMHVTCYPTAYRSWKTVKLCNSQLNVLNGYIENSFLKNETEELQKIAVHGYLENDAFYIARGSFSLFNTCNVWVNKALKETGIQTSVWSPFDFGVLYHLPK